MVETVRITKDVYESMLADARGTPTQECCGLLAGREGVISEIYAARNALESATEFEIAPQELFGIFRAMREAGLEHMGIYHSHPRGPATPSARDIERAYYPDAAYFVISVEAKAFVIREGRVEELQIRIV